ncbi:MAG: hypothetical protein HWQ38_10300 [Nostoc sp. NMS7]|uniref:hypothetical protein n=1 Tax=Nostoc sp. NMS7 TaxID=2815391 RepID=UPI0025F35C0C|nr:hypothetical protein [Nostoc sp. NMS7]MBN3946855.1 hypothetical protein [Nostoc sp. NMS7]
MVNGIINAVEEKDNHLMPLEFKKGRVTNHQSDRTKLTAFMRSQLGYFYCGMRSAPNLR